MSAKTKTSVFCLYARARIEIVTSGSRFYARNKTNSLSTKTISKISVHHLYESEILKITVLFLSIYEVDNTDVGHVALYIC